MRQHFLQKLGTDWKLAAIVGLSKNAGKTTFLNWIVSKFADKKIGIITTGRDGEDNDLVGGHKKPKVLVPAGSFFSTGEKVIKREANSIKIITKLPYIAGGQRLWLVQATEQIYSEIIGPATAFDQVELAKKIILIHEDLSYIQQTKNLKIFKSKQAQILIISNIITKKLIFKNLQTQLFSSLKKHLCQKQNLIGKWLC